MQINYNLMSDMKRQRLYASYWIYNLKRLKYLLSVKCCTQSIAPSSFVQTHLKNLILVNIICCRVINLTLKTPVLKSMILENTTISLEFVKYLSNNITFLSNSGCTFNRQCSVADPGRVTRCM